jgi:hypothetical protein
MAVQEACILISYRELNQNLETFSIPRMNNIYRKRMMTSKVYPELIHKNTNNNNTESIAGAFAVYFYELYQPNKDDIFDTSALENIKRLYSEITNECNDKPNQLPGITNVTTSSINYLVAL